MPKNESATTSQTGVDQSSLSTSPREKMDQLRLNLLLLCGFALILLGCTANPGVWQAFANEGDGIDVYATCPVDGEELVVVGQVPNGAELWAAGSDCPPFRNMNVGYAYLEQEGGAVVQGWLPLDYLTALEPDQEGGDAESIADGEESTEGEVAGDENRSESENESQGIQNTIIQKENYTAELGDVALYIWASEPQITQNGAGWLESQIEQLKSMPTSGKKMIILSSAQRAIDILQDETLVRMMHEAGIEEISYNSEPDKTPAEEMSNLTNPKAEDNPVALLVAVGHQKGFNVSWGPMVLTARGFPEETRAMLIGNQLDGFIIQMQNVMAAEHPEVAADILAEIASKWDRQTEVTVQIMSRKCGPEAENTWASCRLVLEKAQNQGIIITNVAIWASDATSREELVGFVKSLRANTPSR